MTDRFSNGDSKLPEFRRSDASAFNRSNTQQPVVSPPIRPQSQSGRGRGRYLLVAAVVALAVIIIVLVNTCGGAKAKNEQGAANFVRSATSSNVDDIYGQFSDDLKGMQTKDSLSANIASLNFDSTCKFVSGSVDEGSEGKQTVKGTIECEQKKYNAHFGYNSESKLISYSIAPLN